MADRNIDQILTEIDELVGKPDEETAEDRAKRKQMIERDLRAREIRKGGR